GNHCERLVYLCLRSILVYARYRFVNGAIAPGRALFAAPYRGAARRRKEWQADANRSEGPMKIQVTIQGIAPLLMNRFTEAAEVAVSGGTAVTFKGDKGTPREQAAPKR